jgi:hypothetical protein
VLVAHLEAIREIPDSCSVTMGVCNDYHMMPSVKQALREHVNMIFYTSHIGIEKI